MLEKLALSSDLRSTAAVVTVSDSVRELECEPSPLNTQVIATVRRSLNNIVGSLLESPMESSTIVDDSPTRAVHRSAIQLGGAIYKEVLIRSVTEIARS